MTLDSLITSHIRPANHRQEMIHPDQKTDDIIQLILKADAMPEVQADTQGFAVMLAEDTLINTCHNIFTAIKAHVKFVEDPAGDQFLKTPAKVWADKKCDCKSFSLFVGSILKNLGIPYTYRFVSENKNENIHHVYIAVPDGDSEIIIDLTLTTFNRELPFAYKKDYHIGSASIGFIPATPENTNWTWIFIMAILAIAFHNHAYRD